MSEQPVELWEQKARELLDRIPGYRGYRLKEDRRDADRRVREAVADAFAVELQRVERIARTLATARRLGEISTVERASQAIRRYIDRVRASPSGYGGLYGDRDIDGVVLDQLRLFDESLVLGADELRPAIDRLEAAAQTGEPLGVPAGAIVATVETLLSRLDTRQEVIESGQAASRGSVLAALQPAVAAVPPDAYFAAPGDAVAILGDNYLVDARIDVDGQPRSFRLLRIGKDPEEWLLVEKSRSGLLARLSPAARESGGSDAPAPALHQIGAGTGDGEVIGQEQTSGLRPVRYALLGNEQDADQVGVVLHWDGESQTFTGKRVDPLDVEVFRRSSKG
ncbi:MAG: hypothetical protein U0031_21230 [Thermomicrobiales bacterium]